MLSDQERHVFDELVRQLQCDDTSTPPPGEEEPARAPHTRLLDGAMGLCVVLIVVSGLFGSPEAVLSFTGAIAALTFIRYA